MVVGMIHDGGEKTNPVGISTKAEPFDACQPAQCL
jgi:hypothetical protein